MKGVNMLQDQAETLKERVKMLEEEAETQEEEVEMLEEEAKMLEVEVEMLELFTRKQKNVVSQNATGGFLAHAPNAADSYAKTIPTHVSPKSTVSNV